MKLSDIPIHAVGPGSQPDEEDGAQLDYMALPAEMAVYHMPLLPEPDELEGLDAGLTLMDRIRAASAGYHGPVVFELGGLDARNREFIDQLLGEGEVSIRHERIDARIQESVLAGIWRVQQAGRDYVEVAPVPAVVRDTVFQQAQTQLAVDPAQMPPGVLNAAPVLVELAARSAAWREGGAAHVINLTLLPLSPQDLAEIDRALGRGPVTILSRGYGNCRITATGLRHVWRVQYFNSADSLILDTIEVTAMPQAACAAVEDIEQSGERLGELREMLAA